MKTNMILLSIAVSLIAVVAFRMNILKFDRRFWIDLAPLIAAAGILAFVNYYMGGEKLLKEGAKTSALMTVSFMPMLIIIFITMGEAMALVGAFKENIVPALNGGQGILGSLFAGFIMPGSMTSLPIVKELWESGASKPSLLVFLMTSPLIGWQILLIRQPMLGWKLTGIYLMCGFIVSGLMTLTAWLWILTTTKA